MLVYDTFTLAMTEVLFSGYEIWEGGNHLSNGVDIKLIA